MMNKPKSVSAYIANAPLNVQPRLKEIRKIIKEIVPQAKESISYGLAYYSYKGRLVYFGNFKNHIGLYIPGSTVNEYKEELKEYKTATATIRFPHDKGLPISLIKKLVKARVNEVNKLKP